MKPVNGPADENDAQTAYLFYCAKTNRFAVTNEPAGANLPHGEDTGWQYRQSFPLGVHETPPVDVDPEPVIRALKARGYMVWRAGPVRPIHGTSQ
jgi:hypothetical protein